jgi:CHAD domain-containing protein
MSKAAAAVGPRAAEPPDIPPPTPAGPRDPARAAIAAHLARHARRFLLQDVRVRRDLPDSVHQMRVAARRLRSGLQAFGPLVDPDWAKHLRGELGWIAGELGSVRDTEVMIDRLDEHAGSLSGDEVQLARDAVDRVLSIRITDARSHALAALRSDRYKQLLGDLVAGVMEPQFTPAADATCAEALPPLVDKAWRRLAKDVELLRLHGEAYPWHEARIAAKKARYAAEAVETVFGEPARPLARVLEQVTELLGDHQDAHVAQNTLIRMSADGDLDARAGFALGLLYHYEIDYEMSLRHRFRRLWPKVKKVHRTTRLGGR